jgi:hypothetical protein
MHFYSPAWISEVLSILVLLVSIPIGLIYLPFPGVNFVIVALLAPILAGVVCRSYGVILRFDGLAREVIVDGQMLFVITQRLRTYPFHAISSVETQFTDIFTNILVRFNDGQKFRLLSRNAARRADEIRRLIGAVPVPLDN